MNIKRYFNSFFIASIFYSFLIFTLLYSFDDVSIAPSQNKQSIQNVKFTLINLPKEVAKPKIEKKIIKKEIQKPKKVEKKIVKKTPPKKIYPNKIVKKEEKQKTITKTQKVVKKEIQKPKKKKIVNQIRQQKIAVKNEAVQTDQKQLVINKNKYYTKIKQTIDNNKSYPKVAVRRAIQGEVKIQFTLSKDGELLSYKVLDGKKIFFKSISEAIKNSFPLTPPKDIFTSNLDLKLTLQYKLY